MVLISRFVTLLIFGSMAVVQSTCLATAPNAAFEMEVQERMIATQISATRKQSGVCSQSEIPYWNNLAVEYLSHEMVEQAEKTYYRLLRECIDHKKLYHPDTLAVLANLVDFYLSRSQREKADELNRTVLSAGEQELGSEDTGLIPVLDHLSNYYQKTDQKVKREEALMRALRIVEQSNRSTRLDIAERQLVLAEMYFSQKRNGEAESYYLQSTPVIFAERSRFDESVLKTRENMFKLFTAREKWAEAEPHIQEILAFIQERAGESHPFYIRALGQLALIYANQGDVGDADETLKKAISLAEKGGEKTKEMLKALQEFQTKLKESIADAVVAPPLECNESQRKLRYEQTMIWNERLSSVRSGAEDLSARIDHDVNLWASLDRKDPLYNKKFVQYVSHQLDTWGEQGLAATCLSELSGFEQEIEAYLHEGQTLYESWRNFSSLCTDQGNEELAEVASRFQAHHYDASYNVNMLRGEILTALNEDCTMRKEWDDDIDDLMYGENKEAEVAE